MGWVVSFRSRCCAAEINLLPLPHTTYSPVLSLNRIHYSDSQQSVFTCKRQQIRYSVFVCNFYITGQYCLFHDDSYRDIFGQWRFYRGQCYVLDSVFAGFYSYSVCRVVCRISSWVKTYYRNVRKRNCEVTKFPAYRQIHFSFCDVFQHEDCGSLILFCQPLPPFPTLPFCHVFTFTCTLRSFSLPRFLEEEVPFSLTRL
jgi:hypothetical protein